MLPFILENYGGFEERGIELWELNENIANLVLYRVEKIEKNIESEFKVR